MIKIIFISCLFFTVQSAFALRFYNPEYGRWLNRDPIGVEGGINTYNSVSNNMVNGYNSVGSGSPLGYDSGMSLYNGYLTQVLGVDPAGLAVQLQYHFYIPKYNGLPDKDGKYWQTIPIPQVNRTKIVHSIDDSNTLTWDGSFRARARSKEITWDDIGNFHPGTKYFTVSPGDATIADAFLRRKPENMLQRYFEVYNIKKKKALITKAFQWAKNYNECCSEISVEIHAAYPFLLGRFNPKAKVIMKWILCKLPNKKIYVGVIGNHSRWPNSGAMANQKVLHEHKIPQGQAAPANIIRVMQFGGSIITE